MLGELLIHGKRLRTIKLREVRLTLAALVLLALTAGCPKQSSIPSIPPAPMPVSVSKPYVDFFTAEPTAVTMGQSSSLRWSVQDARHVQIDHGIGEVEPSGSRGLKLDATTVYKLEATNAAGTTVSLLTITVGASPPAAVSGRQGGESPSLEVLTTRLQDIHFSYDRDEILETEKSVLDNDMLLLKDVFASDPGVTVVIEGHCDERGSSEYNIALGDKRANFVKGLFISRGLPENKLNAVSLGKEKPACLELTEDCFSRNRRVHFSASR